MMQCECPKCSALRSSVAFVLACTPGKSFDDVDLAVFGLAIVLDKPIILVCPPGSKVPEKLAKVVDRFIEFDPDPKAVVAAVSAALIEMGLISDGRERGEHANID